MVNAQRQKVHIQHAAVTVVRDKPPEDMTHRWDGHTQEHREVVWRIQQQRREGWRRDWLQDKWINAE